MTFEHQAGTIISLFIEDVCVRLRGRLRAGRHCRRFALEDEMRRIQAPQSPQDAPPNIG